MSYSSLAKQGVRNAVATAAYVALLALLMTNIESVLGNVPAGVPEVVAAITMMMLFMVSALVTGSLVLWTPLKLLVDGKKTEAGVLLCITGTTLAGILLLVLLTAFII